ncbi:MAG: NADH-quinone oxidoreductase subunit F, partial [Gammaproteobacteria bacterium]|nr:NADH-quinone oxidoreductase subunit F [Gammaproteobacteria bacterium]
LEQKNVSTEKDQLIEILHVINDTFGCLPKPYLRATSRLIGRNEADVYGVASFYHHFKIVDEIPDERLITIRVCDGLSCCMSGAKKLFDTINRQLESERSISVVNAPCVGRCEQAPIAVVQRNPILNARPEDVIQAVESRRFEHPHANPDRTAFDPAGIVTADHGQIKVEEINNPDWVGLDVYVSSGGYSLLGSIHDGSRSRNGAITELKQSNLRGLGGAGFGAGQKWDIVSSFDGPRYLVVNLDEGEPGTFKDRNYLERDPHRFLEGLLIAADIIDAKKSYIYIRDEYSGGLAILSQAIGELIKTDLVGLDQIEIRRGAGAYICGEESALIESIEGKRGEPRQRPPYVAEKGLFNRPTLVHNFETLYWVRDILERGALWFTSFGRRGRKGLRSFSVSGRVKNPGVKIAPAGISLIELVEEFCGGMLDGHDLYGYLPGGASGGILPSRLADIPLDFDTLQEHGCFIGSAAVVVLSQHDKAREAATNAMEFFVGESCGQCSPCRLGTHHAARLMKESVWDITALESLSHVLKDASICGLGQAAPNVIDCVRNYFPAEIRDHD